MLLAPTESEGKAIICLQSGGHVRLGLECEQDSHASSLSLLATWSWT